MLEVVSEVVRQPLELRVCFPLDTNWIYLQPSISNGPREGPWDPWQNPESGSRLRLSRTISRVPPRPGGRFGVLGEFVEWRGGGGREGR